ncbi:MAG: hypothetical protein IJT18_04105 [Oscillospiraceae bacterium]|nr:hypothetical protein [Oscillospiraceae bacterium]
MWNKLRDGISRFMAGRYGMDQLGMALLAAALVFVFLSRFVYAPLWIVSPALLGFAVYRTYSRNIERRTRENTRFLHLLDPLRDREHRYFRCPKCRQKVRVPRGKGRIAIRCPKCGERFERTT